jgi:hypothetical protein
MAIKFNDLKGKATRGGPERMKFVEGANNFRIVSGIVPGYKYWLTTRDGSSVPMDCLGFDREKEEFTNVVQDWVKEYFPDKKCSWAYSCLVIDRADEKLKILDLKKTLLGHIIKAAKKFGDPSDREDGWDILCSRIKTGPKTFNVEYNLEHYDLANSALTDEDKELVKEMPDIEELLKLPTPEVQLAFLKRAILPEVEGEDDPDADEEAAKEAAEADDIN